jgi:hypothetical protein
LNFFCDGHRVLHAFEPFSGGGKEPLIDIKEAVKRNPSSKKCDDLLFEIKSAMNE